MPTTPIPAYSSLDSLYREIRQLQASTSPADLAILQKYYQTLGLSEADFKPGGVAANMKSFRSAAKASLGAVGPSAAQSNNLFDQLTKTPKTSTPTPSAASTINMESMGGRYNVGRGASKVAAGLAAGEGTLSEGALKLAANASKSGIGVAGRTAAGLSSMLGGPLGIIGLLATGGFLAKDIYETVHGSAMENAQLDLQKKALEAQQIANAQLVRSDEGRQQRELDAAREANAVNAIAGIAGREQDRNTMLLQLLNNLYAGESNAAAGISQGIQQASQQQMATQAGYRDDATRLAAMAQPPPNDLLAALGLR